MTRMGLSSVAVRCRGAITCNRNKKQKESFCFFFQKEALSCVCIDQASGSFLKKRTKKLSHSQAAA
jgi:hypothetical protein